jgi:hypothetical protein
VRCIGFRHPAIQRIKCLTQRYWRTGTAIRKGISAAVQKSEFLSKFAKSTGLIVEQPFEFKLNVWNESNPWFAEAWKSTKAVCEI